jgi:hypothetical protein
VQPDRHQCQEPPCQAAPSDTRNATPRHDTPDWHPQVPGLLHQLDDARERARKAELGQHYVAAREARRVAHRLKRKLRPTPVPVARWLPIGDVIRLATGR